MAKERERFVKGALEKGHPPKKVEKIFDLMEQFAGYGFNKSHSAAYAYLAFVTAYLKGHYPVDFMAALTDTKQDAIAKLSMVATRPGKPLARRSASAMRCSTVWDETPAP